MWADQVFRSMVPRVYQGFGAVQLMVRQVFQPVLKTDSLAVSSLRIQPRQYLLSLLTGGKLYKVCHGV